GSLDAPVAFSRLADPPVARRLLRRVRASRPHGDARLRPAPRRHIVKVALVTPPWLRPGHYGVRAGSRWPHFEEDGSRYMPFPFYLAYAAALLENDGFTAAVFDGCATKDSDETYLRRVVDFAPDILIQENA